MTFQPRRAALAAAAPLVLGLAAAAPPAAALPAGLTQGTVRIERCLELTETAFGGETLHVEFESRGGRPTYEFIVESGDGTTYYVGCDARTGVLGEVDVVVAADDPRWTALAKVDEAAARAAAVERYKGEVEEVKLLLLADGGAAYEVDVEVEGADGEFNVYVDAATGRVRAVNVEYWEIGRPAAGADDDG